MSNGWSRLFYINEMKQKISILIYLLFFCVASYSQENGNSGKLRNKYINISFAKSTMEQDDFPKLKSNYGVGFTVGKTFYLHKKPLANCLRFGIDATWFDINYTNYKIEHITYLGTNKYEYHQGEISMHVGPSLTITPVKGFNVAISDMHRPIQAYMQTTSLVEIMLLYLLEVLLSHTQLSVWV